MGGKRKAEAVSVEKDLTEGSKSSQFKSKALRGVDGKFVKLSSLQEDDDSELFVIRVPEGFDVSMLNQKNLDFDFSKHEIPLQDAWKLRVGDFSEVAQMRIALPPPSHEEESDAQELGTALQILDKKPVKLFVVHRDPYVKSTFQPLILPHAKTVVEQPKGLYYKQTPSAYGSRGLLKEQKKIKISSKSKSDKKNKS
jgi:hypothetical protein